MKRLGCSSDEKTGRLQIVPWVNKEEWMETYQQVYSDKTEMQEKAYTQMCIWKARYPNLPLGVECTMSMLHVRLCDKQSDDNSSTPYKDRDLQLLYSTAVMRFLNHVTVMSNVKDSMYKMAERHSIPDWLINLRHEAAHGNALPALYLLRQAGNVIMQWLQEHYWQTEAEVMEDVIVDPQQRREEVERVTELLRLWLRLKTLYWSGRKTIDKIPDEQTREKAMKLAKEEGVGIKLPDTGTKQSGNVTITDASHDDDGKSLEGNNSQEGYTHKIKTAFEPLLRKLLDPLKSKAYKRVLYQGCLIESLVGFQGFCPNIRVDEIDELATLELMSLLAELWKELIACLQTQGLLAQLMTVLSQSPDVSSAQLWLRLFCQLLAGQAPSHPPGSLPVARLLADRLPCDVDPQVLVRKVNSHHARHQSPLHLKPPSAEEVGVLQDLADSVLHDPSPFTARYLDCLLQFHSLPLTPDSRQRLCALARVYTGQTSSRDDPRPSTVHTLASLLDLGLNVNVLHESPDLDMADATLESGSHWKLYSGDADWSRCALGTLPW